MENKLRALQIRRKHFRENVIPKHYNWIGHVTINIGILISLSTFFIWQINSPSWRELLTLPIMLVFGNFFVWSVHKFPLHRRDFPLIKFPYQRHTVEHHTFFTHEANVFEGARDVYNVMFPPEVVVGFALIFIPGVYLFTSLFLTHNAQFLVLLGCSGYFLLYEFVHTCSHLKADHPFLKFRPLKEMWEHHRLHHNPKFMGSKNFGIVFPWADKVMGTYYREK